MTTLWTLLLEAQDSPAGIPRSFVEEKKAEMRNANKGDERVLEERERRRLDEVRDRERGQRDRDAGFGGRGRGRGRGRGGWDDSRRGRDSGWGQRGGGVSRVCPTVVSNRLTILPSASGRLVSRSLRPDDVSVRPPFPAALRVADAAPTPQPGPRALAVVLSPVRPRLHAEDGRQAKVPHRLEDGTHRRAEEQETRHRSEEGTRRLSEE